MELADAAVGDKPLIGGLDTREWLCILPAPVVLRAEVGERAPEDPAADARAADPLGPAAVLDAASSDALLLFLTRVSLALAPFASRGILRVASTNVILSLLTALLWTEGRGMFGTTQIAATTAVFVFETLVFGFILPLALIFAAPSTATSKAPESGTGAKNPEPEKHRSGFFHEGTLSTWPEAGFWRYRQLCKRSSQPLLFLKHIEDDHDCSCPRLQCAGSIAKRSGVARLSVVTLFWLWTLAYNVCRHFTFWVTLGQYLWFSPWAIAGVLTVIGRFTDELTTLVGGSGFTDNVAVRDLDRRLQLRAVRSSLDALVAHFRAMVDAGTESAATDAETQYAELLPFLACRWRQDNVLPQSAALSVVIIVTELTAIIVYVTTGSCIPIYAVLFGAFGLVILGVALTNAVVGNARITQTSALLRSAALSLRRLIVAAEAAQPPTPASDRLARRIASHVAVLSELAEVRGAEARLLGAPVTGGLARRLLAGTLTACFAAWTVLRATGVTVTIQNVCPS